MAAVLFGPGREAARGSRIADRAGANGLARKAAPIRKDGYAKVNGVRLRRMIAGAGKFADDGFHRWKAVEPVPSLGRL
jgi:hypothetical protein